MPSFLEALGFIVEEMDEVHCVYLSLLPIHVVVYVNVVSGSKVVKNAAISYENGVRFL